MHKILLLHFLTGCNCSRSFPLFAQMSSVFCFWVFVLWRNPLLTKRRRPPDAETRLSPSRAVFDLRNNNYMLLYSLALLHTPQEIRLGDEAATLNCWYDHYLHGNENKQPLQVAVLLVCEPQTPVGLGSCLCFLRPCGPLFLSHSSAPCQIRRKLSLCLHSLCWILSAGGSRSSLEQNTSW